jgi:hypothetical protein
MTGVLATSRFARTDLHLDLANVLDLDVQDH